ncbi:MAG: methyltransferase [Candidatus Aegiribacteria sp.]|nr:methyltransferase [Candidatus Aegiribacteria sp.]MBD3294393.1 methyltransferase [Candidatus Fermentibacteria bacterium]
MPTVSGPSRDGTTTVPKTIQANTTPGALPRLHSGKLHTDGEITVLPGGGRVYTDPSVPCTTDTLLSASLLEVPPGSTVVDLGCGSGGGIFYASGVNPECRWIGIDVRLEALKLLLVSVMLNQTPSDISPVCCDVRRVPLAFRRECAQAVIANPPYGKRGYGRESPDCHRKTARSGEDLLLHSFTRAASHLLVAEGSFMMVVPPRRFADALLSCRAFGLSPASVQPVGEPDCPAELTVIVSKKGSTSKLEILPQTEPGKLLC